MGGTIVIYILTMVRVEGNEIRMVDNRSQSIATTRKQKPTQNAIDCHYSIVNSIVKVSQPETQYWSASGTFEKSATTNS